MTTRDEIREWLEVGKSFGATHMIVVCDSFDYMNYPAYVLVNETARDRVGKLDAPNKMSKVMEVYSYALDLEVQLHEHRAWHVE